MGWMETHAPISVLWVVHKWSKSDMGEVMVRSLAMAVILWDAWAALCPLHIAFWWLEIVSRVQSSRLLMRTAVHAVDDVWLSSAKDVKLGTPMPADLAGKESGERRSERMVVGAVLLRSTGRKTVQMAVSMETKCSDTSDTMRSNYYHLCWCNWLNAVVATWGNDRTMDARQVIPSVHFPTLVWMWDILSVL